MLDLLADEEGGRLAGQQEVWQQRRRHACSSLPRLLPGLGLCGVHASLRVIIGLPNWTVSAKQVNTSPSTYQEIPLFIFLYDTPGRSLCAVSHPYPYCIRYGVGG